MDAMQTMQTLLANAGGDWDGGWWILWPLFWLAVIAGVVWFLTRRRGRGDRDRGERAREILAERFARGEISGDEYRERLAQL